MDLNAKLAVTITQQKQMKNSFSKLLERPAYAEVLICKKETTKTLELIVCSAPSVVSEFQIQNVKYYNSISIILK